MVIRSRRGFEALASGCDGHRGQVKKEARVDGIWQFVNWVATPSCRTAASAPAVLDPVQAGGPPQVSAHAAALNRGDCPCPHSAGAQSP